MKRKEYEIIDVINIKVDKTLLRSKGDYVKTNTNIYEETYDLRAQKCPVCNGTGHVPYGFYTQNLEGNWTTWTTSTTGHEICRSCHGLGYIVV